MKIGIQVINNDFICMFFLKERTFLDRKCFLGDITTNGVFDHYVRNCFFIFKAGPPTIL